MNAEKQLRKAAKRLRKAVKNVNRFDERALEWSSTYLPPTATHKQAAYWVDEHSVSPSYGEGYRTVVDVSGHLDDAVYIALMHPPVALLLAKVLDNVASLVKEASAGEKLQIYGPEIMLAREINRGWKARAKRE